MGSVAGEALESEGEEASELEQFPDTEVVQVRACARATQREGGCCQAGRAAYSHWGWLRGIIESCIGSPPACAPARSVLHPMLTRRMLCTLPAGATACLIAATGSCPGPPTTPAPCGPATGPAAPSSPASCPAAAACRPGAAPHGLPHLRHAPPARHQQRGPECARGPVPGHGGGRVRHLCRLGLNVGSPVRVFKCLYHLGIVCSWAVFVLHTLECYGASIHQYPPLCLGIAASH